MGHIYIVTSHLGFLLYEYTEFTLPDYFEVKHRHVSVSNREVCHCQADIRRAKVSFANGFSTASVIREAHVAIGCIRERP